MWLTPHPKDLNQTEEKRETVHISQTCITGMSLKQFSFYYSK